MSRPVRAAALGGSMLGAALALATPFVMRWEGKRNTPYRDIAGVQTVCYGETQVPMRRYSDAECTIMLARRVENEHGRSVIACVPGLARKPHALAASISLSYNIGAPSFCRSSAARAFRAGDWTAGCATFPRWNRAGGRVVTGLVRRREAERQLCLRDTGKNLPD